MHRRSAEEDRMPAVIAGDGALLYGEVIGDHSVALAPPALAGTIGRLAVSYEQAGRALTAAAIQPLYVRRPDVEIARDQARLAVEGVSEPQR
jgi:hypothetical protein